MEERVIDRKIHNLYRNLTALIQTSNVKDG